MSRLRVEVRQSRLEDTSLPALKRRRFYLRPETPFAHIVYAVRRRLALTPHEALFFFSTRNNTLVAPQTLIGPLHARDATRAAQAVQGQAQGRHGLIVRTTIASSLDLTPPRCTTSSSPT